MLAHVDVMLWAWARTIRRLDDAGIGYKRSTIEAELIEMGGVLIRGVGRSHVPHIDVPDDIARIDTAIMRLPEEMMGGRWRMKWDT